MPTLVVNQGAIGDLLLSLPAMRLLRKVKCDFTLAAQPYQGLFLKKAKEVASVIPCTARAFSELYTGSIPPLLQYFDDIWWFSRRRGLVPDVYLLHSNDWSSQVIFTVDEGPDMRNCAMFQFEQVKKCLGMEDESIEEFLYPMCFSRSPEDRQLFDLVIHPGSGSRTKCWPVEKFLETAEEVLKHDSSLRLLFVLGPAEEEMGHEIMSFVEDKDGRVLYMQGQDIMLVADTLGGSSHFLGNDSGISHLAAWCGACSIILFGPTQPGIWKPPLANLQVIISPASCSPCGDAYRKCTDVHCMEDIQVKDVTEVLLKHLAR